MIAMPQKVTIGPYVYSIHLDRAEIGKARYDQDSSALVGAITYNGLKIMVDPDSAPSRQQETLLHEMLHGMWCAIDMDNRKEGSPQEDVIKRLSPMLLDTLRRNPEVLRYLMGDS